VRLNVEFGEELHAEVIRKAINDVAIWGIGEGVRVRAMRESSIERCGDAL
jgi:hypothetical protein